MQIGDKVIYTAANGKEATGVIHGVRKIGTKSGEKVVGYLVDTGKTHMVDTIVTEGKKPNEKVSQPKLVDLEPEFVRLDD